MIESLDMAQTRSRQGRRDSLRASDNAARTRGRSCVCAICERLRDELIDELSPLLALPVAVDEPASRGVGEIDVPDAAGVAFARGRGLVERAVDVGAPGGP